MSSTTSRWISRSWSNASASWREVDRALDRVLDGHEAEVDLARLDGVEHVGDGAAGRRARPRPGRAGCSSACSVNVPSGPRNPTRGPGRSRGRHRLAGDSGTGWQDSEVDAAALRALLDDVAAGRVSPDDAAPRLRRLPVRRPRLRPRRPPPRRCARACPRRSTGRARRPSSAPASSPSCSPTAPARCCSPAPTAEQAEAALAAQPGGRRRRARPSSGGPAAGDRPERGRGRHGRHGRRLRGRRVRDRARAPTASPRHASPTSAWPACTACSPTSTSWPPPTPSSSSPAWRARWPA